jgi:hypothetical protein
MILGRRTFLTMMSASPLAATPVAAQTQSNLAQFYLVHDFKAVGDGTRDNSAALNAFNLAAKTEHAAGRGVVLHCPPGVYNFNHALCQGYLHGIGRLAIYGHGAAFQNTYDPTVSGANFGAEQAWGWAAYPDRFNDPGKEIQTVSVGSSTFVLKPPADSSDFVVGDWLMIGSLDIQYYGFPPNLHYFEYVKISSINPSTGVIGIEQTIRWPHRDDFPDNGKQGKARVWRMRSNHGITWDVEHTYVGLEIRNAPKTTVSYISALGRQITYEDCTLPGLSQTVAHRVVMRGGALTAGNEPDKLVDQCVYDGVDIKTGLNFQSSSINSASLRDCYLDGILLVGQVKSFHALNCDIAHLAEGGVFGLNLETTLENCLVRRMDAPIRNFGPETLSTRVDGKSVKFANGKFVILKGFNEQLYWNAVPGAALNLRATTGGFSGDLGTGYITSMTDDATHMYWETTLRFDLLPAWADGYVRIQKAGRIRLVNCTGCTSVTMASAAAAVGKEPWEYRRYLFLGVADQTGNFAGCDGILTKVTINVIQAGPPGVPGARLALTQYGAVTADGMADPQTYIITIDISVAGKRQFSIDALTGKQEHDAVTVAGVAQSALPSNRHCWNVLTWVYSGFVPSSYTARELPIIEVILEFDAGSFRNGIPMTVGSNGKAIAGVVGGIP